MESMSELYINEIVNSLLEHRAAILVGAGFSRNADPVNSNQNIKMPMWNGLIDKFCDRLGIDEEHRKYLNTLTVAQELEESYGRPYLDKMIKDVMNDDAYEPTDIHVNLMSLHWSDVFTTNYDTLLERAAKKVPDYRYQFILDQKDLIYSAGIPRLIKLHGSFPSNGPFVITEEDFRTYPIEHAPFVNTVQQSLLENTFCLIGFSGDDPNFLKWIGWVHDNLGLKNSPVIYMITHRHFSPAKENDLTSKKIKVIALDDITRYQNKSITNNDDYIKELYRNFLQDLVKRTKEKEEEGKNWPGSDIYTFSFEKHSLSEIRDKLKEIHDQYPGWILVPFSKQKGISYFISQFENDAINRIHFNGRLGVLTKTEREHLDKSKAQDKKLTDAEKANLYIEIIYEYSWLNSIIGRPLSSESIKEIASFLSTYGSLTKEEKNDKSERDYSFILLMELRSHRIYGNLDEWKAIFDELSIKASTVDQKNQLIFEDIYHDIYNLKLSEIEPKINDIATDSKQPVWCLRKAGLWASIGRYAEAAGLLMPAINEIRFITSDNAKERDIRARSIESCLVSLYNFVLQAKDFSSHIYNNQSNDYLVGPKRDADFDFIWDQEDLQYVAFLSDDYNYRPETVKEPNFDLGSVSLSTSLGRDNNDYFTALEFITFREITGIPFKLSNVVNKNGVLGTAKRLAPYSATLPVVLSILAEDDKIVKNVWSRGYLASISLEEVDELTGQCLKCLNTSIDILVEKKIDVFNKNLQVFPVSIMPEVLSRLCSKCSDNNFDELLHILQKCYNNWNFRSIPDLRQYVKRVISNIPLRKLATNIDIFLSLPLMPEDAIASTYFPECFYYIYGRLQNVWTDNEHLKLPMNDTRETLLDQIIENSHNKSIHHNAIRRLTYVSQIFDLTREDRKKLSDIILDPGNYENNKPYIGDFLQSSIGLFINDSEENRVNQKNDQDDWDTFIQKINTNANDASFTDYSDLLNSGIGYVQHNMITREQVEELAASLLLLCTKIADKSSHAISFGLVGNAVENGLKSSAELMGEAILSAGLLDDNKAYKSDKVQGLWKLFQATDTPCSLLDFCLNESGDREKAYLNTMFCGKKRQAADAVSTLYSLYRYGITIPEAVKDTLIEALFTAMSVETTPFVQGVEFLVRKKVFTTKELTTIDQTLPKFLNITAIEQLESEAVISRKMLLRKWCAYLAHTLFQVEELEGVDITPGVNQWKTINEGPEEFAEIRNSWDDVSGLMASKTEI